MSSEPDALRLARKLVHGPWSSWMEHADDLLATAAELRRLHAENEELRKKVGAYKMLERAQAEQLSTLREQQDKFREAVASLQSERDANAILTAEIEADRAAMREALEVLQEGREALQEQAQEFHRAMAGYRFALHEAMDESVRRADAVIEKLKARVV